jgi:hypothetical protein
MLACAMRIPPSVSFGGTLAWTDGVGFNAAVSNIRPYFSNPSNGVVQMMIVDFASNGAARWPGALSATPSVAYIEFSAEI